MTDRKHSHSTSNSRPPRNPRPQAHHPSLHVSPPNPLSPSPVPSRPRVHSSVHLPSDNSSSQPILFPEPQIYRAVSDNNQPQAHLFPSNSLSRPRSSHSLRSPNLHRGPSASSVASTASSYYHADDDYIVEDLYLRDSSFDSLIDDINRLSINADEAVRQFQKGELRESDQEWHKMVPKEAIEAFGKQEVQRQSVIFEVFKAERDYVADLRSIQDLFINGLRKAPSPIIKPPELQNFIDGLFGNLSDICEHHERMLAALFKRQRDQHPLVQSISDIILDTVLRTEFRSAYEDYIKHYPISESIHRKELKSNAAYKAFLDSVSDNPRIRKRDLVTFLSRAVTRLPRLSLVLEQILKLTDKGFDNPDLESLPIILSILSDFLKSTQPGIEAAESKAKLWELSENLEYQKGEIIDMDLGNESRTLFYSGPVVRRVRGDTGFSSWIDLTATLLDNYFILTRDIKRADGSVKKQLMSRPIPLSHLQYAAFDSPPEGRRERSEEKGILESLRYQTVDIYPFVLFHSSNPYQRRYALCAASEVVRRRWKSVLDEANVLYRVRQEANMWYDPRTLTDGFFRSPSTQTYTGHFTGKALSAAPFASGGRRFISVSCQTGIYASTWGLEEFKLVLNLRDAEQLAAVQELGGKQFRRLVVHHDHTILSYSLDVLARVVTGQAQGSTLEATMERVSGNDSNVLFMRVAEIGQRLLVMYASKRLLQVSPTLHVLEAVDVSGAMGKRSRNPATFHPFGEPGYVPKDASDISPLARNVGVVTHDGIVIADPMNFAKSTISLVPDLHSGNDSTITLLRDRIADAKPLGLIRVTPDELMVVYDTMGCYITKHGVPTRSSGFVKWETAARSYAFRGHHILLFSPQFIEIRDVRNGRIVQVIEGVDIRLLHFDASVGNTDPIIVGMKGKGDDKYGASDRLVELAETVELNPISPVKMPSPFASPLIWDEWDM